LDGRLRSATALLVGAFFAALLSTPVAGEVHQLDGEATRAEFSLRVIVIRKLEGRFARIEGEIERDDQRPLLRVDVRIAADSLSMPNPTHTAWAHSEEFFATDRHPWIRFRSDTLSEPLLFDGGELHGELELRGVILPQVLQITPAACARPGFDCPVIATAELRRSRFGMDARRVAVSDRVRLQLQIWLQQ
jgi:polyisoprenoid-binding protein YceI